ncbi:hypothetical protein JCM3766R1_005898 [Sporobolomyces carnicolor]
MSAPRDLLDLSNLVSQCASLAPASTRLTSLAQVVSLVLHAIHSSLSFRLIDPKPAHENSSELPSDWLTANGFKYRHDQSSLEFLVSVVDLGDKLLIVGNAIDNARSSSFEILKTDYFSSSTTPTSSSPLSPQELSETRPFSTSNRFKDFIVLYRLNVLQKLVPGLSKDGYSELTSSDSSTAARGEGGSDGRVAGTRDYLPDRGGPMGMYPERGPPRPVGDDPLRIPGSGSGRLPIGEIGRNDLEPLGGMGGTFGMPGGRGGLPGPGAGQGGGMFMGPDHPLFRERFGDDTDGGGGGARRWGGDGYLPPIGAPPGARFDPIGPENGAPGSTGPAFGLPQGTLGGRGGRGGGGIGPLGGGGIGPLGGGRGGGGRQVHPDLEQPGPQWGRGGGAGGFGNMFG